MRYSMRPQHTMVIAGTGMLREAVREEGPVELLVVWIHDEDGPAPPAIHDAAAEVGYPIRIVPVMDSATAGPERSVEARSAKSFVYPDVTHQQVVLGFHRESDGAPDGLRTRKFRAASSPPPGARLRRIS